MKNVSGENWLDYKLQLLQSAAARNSNGAKFVGKSTSQRLKPVAHVLKLPSVVQNGNSVWADSKGQTALGELPHLLTLSQAL